MSLMLPSSQRLSLSLITKSNNTETGRERMAANRSVFPSVSHKSCTISAGLISNTKRSSLFPSHFTPLGPPLLLQPTSWAPVPHQWKFPDLSLQQGSPSDGVLWEVVLQRPCTDGHTRTHTQSPRPQPVVPGPHTMAVIPAPAHGGKICLAMRVSLHFRPPLQLACLNPFTLCPHLVHCCCPACHDNSDEGRNEKVMSQRPRKWRSP